MDQLIDKLLSVITEQEEIIGRQAAENKNLTALLYLLGNNEVNDFVQ